MSDIVRSQDDWREYLQEGQRRSVEGILEFGKRIYEYKLACPKKQGGSTFKRDIKAWLGMNDEVSRQWAKIGERFGNELPGKTWNFPSNYDTVYRLALLTPEQFAQALEEKVINPECTRADVKASICMFQSTATRTRM